MQVLLANPRGFCAGVDRAIDIVERALQLFGAPIHVRHEVVHNHYVVERLRGLGAVFVEELAQVPSGGTVIFSAHGVSRAVEEEARTRRLTVFDANSFAVRTALTLLSSPPFASNPSTNQFQYAVPPVASCAPAALYAPGTTRFRVFTTASVDSSRVYVSMCDAGSIAIVTTTTSSISPGGNTPDTLVTDLVAPFSAGSSPTGGEPHWRQP